jgi:transcriptional regulator with XRE-family HTH domain
MVTTANVCQSEGILTVTVDTTGLPIGQALKVERTLARVSLTTVSRAVDVSIGQLSRIESGERTATPEMVERIRAVVQAAARVAPESESELRAAHGDR